jgi:UTP--glucose-1-phosphate uridylyltransferase
MINKAVIPAAGAGTRLLPATKAQPKEMLPILDTPAIQYVVEEAVESGIEEILVITAHGKRAIEDHFAPNPGLESHLESRGDQAALDTVREIGKRAKLSYVEQPSLSGLGDAVRQAEDFVGDEPFAVLLGDTLLDGPKPTTRRLMEAHEEHGGPVLAVEDVPPEKVSRYGIVEGARLRPGLFWVHRLIEKPKPGQTDSTLAIAGRYVLTPEVFKALSNTKPGQDGEVQLTDALATMLKRLPIAAVPIKGQRYDIGNKQDYLNTILAFALKRKEYARVLRSFLASRPASWKER